MNATVVGRGLARHASQDRLAGWRADGESLGYVDGMSLYEYVGSNPANKVDPTGLYADEEGDYLWDEFGYDESDYGYYHGVDSYFCYGATDAEMLGSDSGAYSQGKDGAYGAEGAEGATGSKYSTGNPGYAWGETSGLRPGKPGKPGDATHVFS